MMDIYYLKVTIPHHNNFRWGYLDNSLLSFFQFNFSQVYTLCSYNPKTSIINYLPSKSHRKDYQIDYFYTHLNHICNYLYQVRFYCCKICLLVTCIGKSKNHYMEWFYMRNTRFIGILVYVNIHHFQFLYGILSFRLVNLLGTDFINILVLVLLSYFQQAAISHWKSQTSRKIIKDFSLSKIQAFGFRSSKNYEQNMFSFSYHYYVAMQYWHKAQKMFDQ